jgi:hypothetical protein
LSLNNVARTSRWLIFAPVAILALFAPQANAEPIAGLETYYYTIDSVPPTRSEHIYTECGSEVENNINRSYDGEPFEDCTVDLFMVHMTGFITIPEHDTIEFWLASDDGGTINIDGNEWGNWNDQGCSWMASGQIDISAGSQSLDLWMYENGGNTCLMLAWNINNQGWSIVPDEAFTTTSIPMDTTTTIQETTTSWETTTTSTSTTTTTSTIAPSTTVPVTPNLTTTTLQTTTSLDAISETTLPTIQLTTPATMLLVEYPTTTILQEPATTFPDPFPVLVTLPNATVQPPETLPFVIPTLPDVIQAIIPDIPVEPPVSLPNATETPDTVLSPPTTFPADTPLLPALSDAEFEAVLNDLQDALPDEVTAIVTTLLTTEVTSSQAVQVVSSPEVLAVISGEQAEQLFDAVDESALTVEEQIDIVAAVQDAPTEVKEAFENQINIFGGEGFDDYVPVDSNVSVAVRRTIIVGTTILVAMPSPVARRNRV